MITVGSIVSLHGQKYKVFEIQVHEGRSYPSAVRAIDSFGKLNSHMHTDSNGGWVKYHQWELISAGIPEDPKAKIIAKIKYLDEKFKKAQALKKALQDPNVSSVSVSPIGVPPVDWSTTASFTRTGRETSTSYREFMEYYARMQDSIVQRTPY